MTHILVCVVACVYLGIISLLFLVLALLSHFGDLIFHLSRICAAVRKHKYLNK